MFACGGTKGYSREGGRVGAYINKSVSEQQNVRVTGTSKTLRTCSEEHSAWRYKLVYSRTCIVDGTLNLVHT